MKAKAMMKILMKKMRVIMAAGRVVTIKRMTKTMTTKKGKMKMMMMIVTMDREEAAGQQEEVLEV